MCWLLDFEGYSMHNAPPIRVSIHCNSILANHYPERLGQAVCYHAPTLFSMTWRVRAGLAGRGGGGWGEEEEGPACMHGPGGGEGAGARAPGRRQCWGGCAW